MNSNLFTRERLLFVFCAERAKQGLNHYLNGLVAFAALIGALDFTIQVRMAKKRDKRLLSKGYVLKAYQRDEFHLTSKTGYQYKIKIREYLNAGS